jgi:hypothetical protein
MAKTKEIAGWLLTVSYHDGSEFKLYTNVVRKQLGIVNRADALQTILNWLGFDDSRRKREKYRSSQAAMVNCIELTDWIELKDFEALYDKINKP